MNNLMSNNLQEVKGHFENKNIIIPSNTVEWYKPEPIKEPDREPVSMKTREYQSRNYANEDDQRTRNYVNNNNQDKIESYDDNVSKDISDEINRGKLQFSKSDAKYDGVCFEVRNTQGKAHFYVKQNGYSKFITVGFNSYIVVEDPTSGGYLLKLIH